MYLDIPLWCTVILIIGCLINRHRQNVYPSRLLASMSNPQAEPVTGATDPSIQLAGNGNPGQLNAVEIVVICVTIVGFVLAITLVFYCKQLQHRRTVAVQLAERDLERQSGSESGATGVGGDGSGLELKDLGLLGGDKDGILAHVREPIIPESDKESVNPAKVHVEKPPLWKYINKKSPPILGKFCLRPYYQVKAIAGVVIADMR
jgi:hypothetical protein